MGSGPIFIRWNAPIPAKYSIFRNAFYILAERALNLLHFGTILFPEYYTLALDFRFLWVSLAELFHGVKALPEPISATFSGKSQFQKVNKAWIFCGCSRIWTSYKIRPSLMRPPMPDEAVLNEVELSKTTRRLDSVNWRIYCQFQNRKNGFYTWLFSMRL